MKMFFFVILLILFSQYDALSQSQFIDTLESGSSDSNKVVKFSQVTRLITISWEQLDTNGTVAGGSPDSVKLWNMSNSEIISVLSFNLSIGDSLKSEIIFYGSQKKIGWVWCPGIDRIILNMSNVLYLTNRRIRYEITPIF